MRYQRDEQRVHLIVYHLIWCPKRRKKVLVGAVAQRLQALIIHACEQHGWELLQLAIAPDHVHLFLRAYPTNSAADVVKQIKGYTSHELRAEFPGLHTMPSLWTRTYFASTARNVSSADHPRLYRSTKGRVAMRKTFQYRLYPSKTQSRNLDAMRETCRRWYNELLSERKTAYDERGETIGKYAQLRRVKEHKATNPWARASTAMCYRSWLPIWTGPSKRSFVAVKAGENAGYPRFKGRDSFDSFGFKEYGNGFKLDGRRLRVYGIGRIAVRWHRPIEGVVKTLRLIKKASGWYACFSVEYDAVALPPTGSEVGIDVGIASLITTSDGAKVSNPAWYRQAQRRLRVSQRRVARRKNGGANRRKAVAQLARQAERIASRRKDFLNKLAHELVMQYDRIAVEALRIPNMVRNRHLSKSILDASWGYFKQRLHSKAAEAGRVVVEVDPAYTSKTCSGCGYSFEHLSLDHRWIACRCGVSLDRDHNAAINILYRAGQVRWGVSTALAVLPQKAAGL